MFSINEDKSIYVTRGDAAFFAIGANDEKGDPYIFRQGDVVRFKVTQKKNCANVLLQKDFPVTGETTEINILLTEDDTKFGKVISKPTDFWYEVELNPFTEPQTIIGYDDESGAKVFRLFPEGADVPPYEPTAEDIPVVDDELSLTSARPVQNQAIARAVAELGEAIEDVTEHTSSEIREFEDKIRDIEFTASAQEAYIRGIAQAEVAAHANDNGSHADIFAEKNHNHDGVYSAHKHQHTVDDIIDKETLIPGAKVYTGEYIGTGEYGKDAPNRIEMPFEPKFVIIRSKIDDNTSFYTGTWITGDTQGIQVVDTYCTRIGTSVASYDPDSGVFSFYTNANENITQLNIAGTKYSYLAIG